MSGFFLMNMIDAGNFEIYQRHRNHVFLFHFKFFPSDWKHFFFLSKLSFWLKWICRECRL